MKINDKLIDFRRNICKYIPWYRVKELSNHTDRILYTSGHFCIHIDFRGPWVPISAYLVVCGSDKPGATPAMLIYVLTKYKTSRGNPEYFTVGCGSALVDYFASHTLTYLLKNGELIEVSRRNNHFYRVYPARKLSSPGELLEAIDWEMQRVLD